MKGSRQFRAELSELESILSFARVILSKLNNQKKANKFEHVIEEAVINVLHYAFDGFLPGILEIEYELANNQATFIIKDNGFAFNPLENPKPLDRESPLEEREIGGLGIHYILKMTDAVTYELKDGWNILTLIQNLS